MLSRKMTSTQTPVFFSPCVLPKTLVCLVFQVSPYPRAKSWGKERKNILGKFST